MTDGDRSADPVANLVGAYWYRPESHAHDGSAAGGHEAERLVSFTARTVMVGISTATVISAAVSTLSR